LGKEKKDDLFFKNYTDEEPVFFRSKCFEEFIKKMFATLKTNKDERNDVHLYKTIRYPPKAKPPKANEVSHS